MWNSSKICSSSISIYLSSQSHFSKLILQAASVKRRRLKHWPLSLSLSFSLLSSSPCFFVAGWNVALLMSGSLGFVIAACKAVCLWVELLLRGKAGPHRYLGRRRVGEGERDERERGWERRRETGRGCDGDDSKQKVSGTAVKEECFEANLVS